MENAGTRDGRRVFVMLLAFSALLRLTVAVGFINTYDTFWYREWALALPNGLFDVYTRANEISLDYPPVYLILLYPIGWLLRFAGGAQAHIYTQMLLLKFWPVVFDVLTIVLLYFFFRRFGERTGLFAAALWALNPSAFFGANVWGQTDSLMIFLLLAAFLLLYQKRPVAAGVVFGVACLTKFQCLFFTPVFLLYLFVQKDRLRSLLKGTSAALLTGVTVFLPFVAASRDLTLPFSVYFGGQGKYPYCTLNAFNLYGLLGLNWVEDSYNVLPFVDSHIFGLLLGVLSCVLVGWLLVKSARPCPFVGGLLLMQCLFFFVTRMHERYQIVVLPFALAACLLHRDRKFFLLFGGLSIITVMNQALVLFRVHQPDAPWSVGFDAVLAAGSALNLCLFIWSAVVCISFFLREKTERSIESEAARCEAR